MVNGQFKCLGSTQHLKTKFGKGYILIVKVGSHSALATSNSPFFAFLFSLMFPLHCSFIVTVMHPWTVVL